MAPQPTQAERLRAIEINYEHLQRQMDELKDATKKIDRQVDEIHDTIIGVKGTWKVVAIGLGLIGAAISALMAKFFGAVVGRL